MRILASNPDTLGDFVLRQPMYAALAAAGHELALIVRPAVAPLAAFVAPGALAMELPCEVYADDLAERWDRFGELFNAARAFAPDLLLVAPYRWTLFEEKLAEELLGVRRAGMSGRLYGGDPRRGQAPPSRLKFDVVANVDQDDLEIAKNTALAAAVVNRPGLSLPPPKLAAGEPERGRAMEILRMLGLEAGDYWVACVGGTAHVTLKRWPLENWSSLLSRWSAETGRKFLFVGSHDEEADAITVQSDLDPRVASARWTPSGGTLRELIGLTALSAGYVGHDTGPMHIAAALGKPTLAIFGGGHRLRFQPAVEPSVLLTMGVACAGCEWSCSFARPHCVQAVPVADALAAALELERGLSSREARVLPPGVELQARMIREAAEFAQKQLRERADAERSLERASRQWADDVHSLRQQVDARSREAASLSAQASETAEHAERFRLSLEAKGRALDEALSQLAERDAQSREKEMKIQEQHDLLQAKEAAIMQQADELRRRDEALAAQLESAARLRAELEEHGQRHAALAEEVGRLRSEISLRREAAGELDAHLAAQTGAMERVKSEIEGMIGEVESQANSRGAALAEMEPPPLEESTEDIAALREQIRRLEERLTRLEPPPKPPRRTWREIAIQLFIGEKHYRPRPARHIPSLTLVTPVLNAPAALRRTLESVVHQDHAHLQHIVVDRGSTDGTAAVLADFEDRIDQILRLPGAGRCEALAAGFAAATGEVLGTIDAGDLMEPGGALRVAELFSRNRSLRVAYFEDALECNGWSSPSPSRPQLDLHEFLQSGDSRRDGIYFTKWAYQALGGMNVSLRDAAEWDWHARLLRRFGARRGAGNVRTIIERDGAHSPDLTAARQAFLSTLGFAGRLRSQVLHWKHRISEASWAHGSADRLRFPPPASPPRMEAPKFVAGQPVSPLTGRLPHRVLFSSPDPLGGEGPLCLTYFDVAGGAALAYPPLDAEGLNALLAARQRAELSAAPADVSSPYAGYCGSRLARRLSRLPSPYWWLHTPNYADTTAQELRKSLAGLVSFQEPDVRFLNIGCYQGELLEKFQRWTPWRLAGTETNGGAARLAREKGFSVWETSAQDAAMALPVGEVFDVIFVGHLLEHLQNPVLVLRRLRQLLKPGGLLAFNTPNLDSKLAERFGPTWAGWRPPEHRILLTRRGVKRLAYLTDFRVERLRTRTDPYPTCHSVQLNRVGLAGVVPDGAKFADDIAGEGVRLTGWMRLLWDWRGQGDTTYAVLRQL